jgi:hypothetical protein
MGLPTVTGFEIQGSFGLLHARRFSRRRLQREHEWQQDE